MRGPPWASVTLASTCCPQLALPRGAALKGRTGRKEVSALGLVDASHVQTPSSSRVPKGSQASKVPALLHPSQVVRSLVRLQPLHTRSGLSPPSPSPSPPHLPKHPSLSGAAPNPSGPPPGGHHASPAGDGEIIRLDGLPSWHSPRRPRLRGASKGKLMSLTSN